MSEPQRLAIVSISQDLLLRAMKFPENTRILRAQMTPQGDIEIVCEHDSLPAIEHGKLIPQVKPFVEHQREQFRFYWSNEDFKNKKAIEV